MNKRIDQLLVKAGAYFGGEGVDYSNFDPKKFAELIIKEAGEAFWSEACHVSDLAYEEYSRNSKKIRQHFEVNPNEITTAMLDTAINQIEEYKKSVAQQQKENLPHISYGSWELYNKPKKEQE
jgi:hypothetical protein